MIYVAIVWFCVWLVFATIAWPKILRETQNVAISLTFCVGLIITWPIVLLIEAYYHYL